MKHLPLLTCSVLVAAMTGPASVTTDGPRGRAPLTSADTVDAVCHARIGLHGDSTWRLARGEGFTFCVPEKWSARGKAARKEIDAPEWRGPGGTKLTWLVGTPTGQRTRVPFTVTSIGGSTRPARSQPILSPASPPVSTIETIGGALVSITQDDANGLFVAYAVWQGTIPLRFRGEARDRKARELLLDVFRTVRIDAP